MHDPAPFTVALAYTRKQNYPHNVHVAIEPAVDLEDHWQFGRWEMHVRNRRFLRIPTALAEAVKAGNPRRIIALNVGVQDKVRAYTKWEDFTTGEQNEFKDVPESRWVGGEQWYILSFLGCSHQGWGTPGASSRNQNLLTTSGRSLNAVGWSPSTR